MGAIGNLGAAGINSGANLAANAATNATNVLIAKQNNDEAKRQFDTNLEWLKYQYEDSKEYNSASAQRQRLIDAGYNPMFQGSQGSGTATSVGSSSPTAAMSTPTLQSPTFDFLGDALNYASAQKTQSETAHNLVDNEMFSSAYENGFNLYDMQKHITDAQIDNYKKQGRLYMSQTELNAVNKQVQKSVYAWNNENVKYVKEQIKGLSWDNEHKQDYLDLEKGNLKVQQQHINNEYKKILQDIKESNSRIALNDANKQLTDQQVKLAAFDATLQKFGINPTDPPMTSLAAHVVAGDVSDKEALDLILKVMHFYAYKNETAPQFDLAPEAAYMFGRGQEIRGNKQLYWDTFNKLGDWRNIISSMRATVVSDDATIDRMNGTFDINGNVKNP